MKCAAKTDVQASFVSHFRLMTFFFTKCKVVINCAMEICNQFGSVGTLIGNQRADALYFSKKNSIAFGKFNAANITFVFHCIFHSKPSS